MNISVHILVCVCAWASLAGRQCGKVKDGDGLTRTHLVYIVYQHAVLSLSLLVLYKLYDMS